MPEDTIALSGVFLVYRMLNTSIPIEAVRPAQPIQLMALVLLPSLLTSGPAPRRRL